MIAPGLIFIKSLHYICAISSIRRSRCGRVRPNRFNSTFWASSGVVTQRSRTVFFGWLSLVRVGKTTVAPAPLPDYNSPWWRFFLSAQSPEEDFIKVLRCRTRKDMIARVFTTKGESGLSSDKTWKAIIQMRLP